MLNPFADINWKPGLAEKRSFAKSLVIGFPVLAAVFLVAGRVSTGSWHLAFPLWLGGIGAATGAVLWVLPAIALPFYLVWYLFACSMGFVIGNTLMSLFYFVVVTPIGILMRSLGKISLRKTADPNARSYWHDEPRQIDPKRYFRQF